MVRRVSAAPLVLGLAVAGSLLACGGGGPARVALENKVFYEYGLGASIDPQAFEKAHPPLDLAKKDKQPEYIGVAILGGTVRISRPKEWVIRGASNASGGRYVQYLSRNQYLFSIYERPDQADDLWRDILARYEEDVTKAGAEIVGPRVPMATWNAQGRGFVVKRQVQAAKAPLVNICHEYLLRSPKRVVLVQVVHPVDGLEELEGELLRVMNTLEVD
ncbi:MAG: hypothetical protein JNL79_35400 [Myxococcales bacterium]|nr:hypothetical protein [Myxococcales bacterium]